MFRLECIPNGVAWVSVGTAASQSTRPLGSFFTIVLFLFGDFPSLSLCVCVFLCFHFFFQRRAAEGEADTGRTARVHDPFFFSFSFFYLFYNRSTRSDEKQQKKPLQPAEMRSQPVEKATRRILEPRRRVDVVEMDVINWSRSDCCCSSLFPIRVESLIERF